MLIVQLITMAGDGDDEWSMTRDAMSSAPSFVWHDELCCRTMYSTQRTKSQCSGTTIGRHPVAYLFLGALPDDAAALQEGVT